MQEFVYFSEEVLDFPLDENILVTTDISQIKDKNFIVSNSKNTSSEVVADEIDFYIQHSQDTLANKMKNVQKLYKINALQFDLAQDMQYTQKIQTEVLLICSEEEKAEFLQASIPDEFNLFYVSPQRVKAISGHIGNLTVTVSNTSKDSILEVSQIVWYNQTQMAKQQSGTLDPLESSIENVLEILRNNIEKYQYKKFITYDKDICQYHGRFEKTCGKCAEVCPTVAIQTDDAHKELLFSDIDCHGCGGCISVCPSGSLDYAPMNKESIFEISRIFCGHIPLIIPRKINVQNLHIQLPQNILPFKIEGEKFLHEGTLLTLAQESGSQLLFYSDFISKGTHDAINILNSIYQKIYHKDAVLVAKNEKELEKSLSKVTCIENSRYTINERNINKREIFATRLQKIVQENDFGVVHTGEHIHYAQVDVDEKNCTLCLSCVGVCTVNALVANVDDNSLRINPSLCTACGFCEVICPEKECLSIEKDIIKLNPAWFKEEILATDTLFSCEECGKEFSTTKAIEKIAKMMTPLFQSDPVKERTLYCCEDCKPKIMMASYRQNPQNYTNTQGVY